MFSPRKIVVAVTFSFAGAMAWSAPARAQEPPPPELEALIAPTLEEASGVALARNQIAASDLLGAVASLERVMLAHPDAVEARLLYASLLCRLDDRNGARLEVSLLRGNAVPEAAWAEVTGACGDLPRPDAPSGAAQ